MELSIVLVILGLLVGGILGGQSLIRAAELRGTISQLNDYATAVLLFRERYMEYPGDFSRAEDFWGADADGCPVHAVRVAKRETCNGNGDGVIGDVSHIYEIFRAWQHLANAELIGGRFTGIAGSEPTSSATHAVIGDNVPAARISNAGISFQRVMSSTSLFPGIHRNFLLLGGADGGASLDNLIANVIAPADAWNIDSKMDDGKPGSGWIVTYNHSTRPLCASSDNPATAEYQVGDTRPGCMMMFLLEGRL